VETDRRRGGPEGSGTRDEAPDLRPRVRWTFEGSIYLWTTALFSAVALVRGDNLVFLLGALALGCGLASLPLARRNLKRLRVRRSAPERTRVGAPTPIRYEVENAGSRSALSLELEDRPDRAARPAAFHVDVPCVAGGSRVSGAAHAAFQQRGLRRLEPVEVRSRFPLGMALAWALADAPAEVLVRPREGAVTPALRSLLRGRSSARARRVLRERGDEAFHGVREFRDGDDPHRIHWRTTARRGALAVSEWRAEEGRRVVVILGRTPGAAGSPAFERAVSCAATIWRAAHRERLRARLMLGRETYDSEGGRGAFGRGQDALALVKGQGARRPRAALKRLAREPGSRAVVYVASGPEPGIRGRLAAAAGRGGDWLLLRADEKGLARWVGGLP
jgi:uncharacterized protein (DUF58 family)